jgi:guanine nucleotide-binding protein G(i) subunit alpha
LLTDQICLLSTSVLVDGAASMAIPLEPDCQQHAEAIVSAPPQIEGDVLPRDLASAVRHLWADEGIREAFDKRSRLQLNDSAG